jgi:hypothetical protein
MFRLDGRWYHKEWCGRDSHPYAPTKPQQVEEVVEEEESDFAVFEDSNIEYEPIPVAAKKKTYVITTAVSNSPVHNGCFKALLEVSEFYNAELLVVKTKYHNQKSSVLVWDSKIEQYQIDGALQLNENLTLHSQININPTAVRPTSGLEVLCGTSSGIIPHTKLELKVVPTPLDHMPKIITTTGAVTSPIFSDTKAGEKGYAAHNLGGIIVEVIDDKVFHLRHLQYKDGRIYDLDRVFDANFGVGEYDRIPGIVLGDAHFGFIDPEVYGALFLGEDSLVHKLNPKRLVWHDLLDSYSICHHHKNPFQHIAKHKTRRANIRSEVMGCINFIKTICRRFPDTVNLIVESNHNSHLDQWVANSDWKHDPQNAEFYLYLAHLLAKKANFREGYGYTNVGAFEALMTDTLGEDYLYDFIYDSDTYNIKDVIVNFHGHNGANGSRGSALQYGRSGYKYFTGHTHTPGITDNCWTVGTMRKLNCEYLSGLSGWMNTMGLIYPNGTRALINIIDGQYTR